LGLFHPFRDHRRKELGRQPFPSEWARIIEERVPYCGSLHPEEMERLQELIKIFIAEADGAVCAVDEQGDLCSRIGFGTRY
jgi:Mlc titration factor MtfA (ptsG expression regulator)